MEQDYYVVPTSVVLDWQREIRFNNKIEFRKTKYNPDSTKSYKWVINVNCGEENFEEIDWKSFKIIKLDIDDFPVPEV